MPKQISVNSKVREDSVKKIKLEDNILITSNEDLCRICKKDKKKFKCICNVESEKSIKNLEKM